MEHLVIKSVGVHYKFISDSTNKISKTVRLLIISAQTKADHV